jgi:hypothetical protein
MGRMGLPQIPIIFVCSTSGMTSSIIDKSEGSLEDYMWSFEHRSIWPSKSKVENSF